MGSTSSPRLAALALAAALALPACGGKTREAPPAEGPEVGGSGAPGPSDAGAPTGPVPDVAVDHGTLVTAKAIEFADQTADLAGDGDAAIAALAEFLGRKPDITVVRIESHTDGDGDATANQKLTEARALAVARALVAKGLDCHRLVPVGFGATKPIADDATPAGKAQNRRTVLVIAALRGHLIGGQPADGGGVAAGDPCP